jgi:predicted dehydrogenase
MTGELIVSRRRFLWGISTAAGAVALPQLIRSSALGRSGAVAPSERVTLGVVGERGGALEPSARQFQRHADARIVAHGAYDDLSARREIDALLIAGPAACGHVAPLATKDVFCATPENLTIFEGRGLARAVAAGDRVFQAAYTGRYVGAYRQLVGAVREGRIGCLQRIAIAAPNGGWAARLIDVAQWVNDTETLGPVEARSVAAPGFQIVYRYAKGVVLELRRGNPAIRVEGTTGWIASQGWGGRLQTDAPSLLDVPVAADAFLRSADPSGPYRDFLDCVKSRRSCAVPAEVAQRTTTIANLGGMAVRLDRFLQWNPYGEHFVDDASADALRGSLATAWVV